MARNVISEKEVRAALDRGARSLEIPPGSVVTPLASEVAAAGGLKLTEGKGTGSAAESAPQVEPAPAGGRPGEGKVVFGSDHGGYQLKEILKKHAVQLGYEVDDVGTHSEEACDYPDFAYGVAMAVSSGRAWRGVMIDGAGIGSCVVANKVPGVRAACCFNEFTARNAREHNDTNLLTLGSRVVGSEVAKEILTVWLRSWFAGGRHKQRVEKMMDVERRFRK